jgi:hypothetical protein
VVIDTGYGLMIMTCVRRPRYLSGYSDRLRAGDYDRIKRAEIAQWVY